MLAIILSSALLAFSPQTPNVASAITGYSPETAQLLEKFDNNTMRPVRHRRARTIGVELGYNGLGGLGLNVGYNLSPHWSLDAGAGVGFPGLRTGLIGRYNFLTSNWTPFLGLGVDYLFALDREIQHNEGSTSAYSYRVRNSPFGVGTAGVSYQGNRGMTVKASLGYSQLLDGTPNVEVTKGKASRGDRRVLSTLAGSGPVASLMLGYSF